MKINRETLKKIAHLARVEIDPKDEDDLIKDLEQIVSWVEKLDQLDTSDVAPLTHMSFEKNVLREDIAFNSLPKEKGLKNAPDHDNDHFKVPKVLK